jgi:hypothetical protein
MKNKEQRTKRRGRVIKGGTSRKVRGYAYEEVVVTSESKRFGVVSK